MALHVVHPVDRIWDMEKDVNGYFSVTIPDQGHEVRYFFRPDHEQDHPDPASHHQPGGVHGPSQLVDHSTHGWNDAQWRGLPLKELILYELHVGTFTPEGTFQAIVPELVHLKDLGVNAIELMPVNAFPGTRNWGYDGAYPYAVQHSYGGPHGLKELVDAAHHLGIAVFLDLVYNHLGPEGNYFPLFGPYFNDQYKVPWGSALNFDGEWSDGVREFFAGNLVHWIENYHIDGFRMDAIHTVFDNGAVHFWELCHDRILEAQERLGRKVHMIAESDLNSPKVVRSPELGGYGFDAQWLDDLHHSLYVLLDPPGKILYEDYGSIEQLVKAYNDGFVLSGEYVKFRKRRHGRSSAGVSGEKFVAFVQDHDIVGNRVRGERLSMLVDLERLKIAAAAILLSPYLPMLFMGEEFGATTPFFYFVDHSDRQLIKAVQEGRKKEFEKFNWDVEPPDPQDPDTFARSKLDRRQMGERTGSILLQWHKKLIGMRRSIPALKNFNKNDCQAVALGRKAMSLHRRSGDGNSQLLCLFNFSEEPVQFDLPEIDGTWKIILNSRDSQWSAESDLEPEGSSPDDKMVLPGTSVIVFFGGTNDPEPE
jgi:maltooligosyltrehalose trehalohydrolase